MTAARIRSVGGSYLQERSAIFVLLQKISEGLDGHAEAAAAEPDNRGYVGDLQAIRADLQRLSDRLHHEGEYAQTEGGRR